MAPTPRFTPGSYDSLSVGWSGLGSDPTSDIHLLFDLEQVPPATLNHNVLICKMGIRIASSQGHCEKRVCSYYKVLGPGLPRASRQ